MARRRKAPPWYHDFRQRLRFEAEAARANGSLRRRMIGKGKHAEIVYSVPITVPLYTERTLTIRFRNHIEPNLIAVSVDGPTESPHRYGDHDLCMWRPDASPDARWTPDEGLMRLIQYATVHLYREEYWRETGGPDGGVWPGPEAPHGETKERPAA